MTGPAHESQRKITETSLREVFRAEAEQGLETIKSLTIAWILQPDRGIPAELLREWQISGTVKPRVYLTRLLRRRARQIAEASFAQL